MKFWEICTQAGEIAQDERVQGALGYVKEKTEEVRKSETYQKSVDTAGTMLGSLKSKAGEVAASEPVQSAIQVATTTVSTSAEKVRGLAQPVRQSEPA